MQVLNRMDNICVECDKKEKVHYKYLIENVDYLYIENENLNFLYQGGKILLIQNQDITLINKIKR
jgi:hypothetical protein